jgi:hypothetical protein
VRLETLSGPVYIKYPAGVPSLAFELDIDPDGLHAFASAFDRGRDATCARSALARGDPSGRKQQRGDVGA